MLKPRREMRGVKNNAVQLKKLWIQLMQLSVIMTQGRLNTQQGEKRNANQRD
jgi:hypothetical protein